MCDAFTTRQRFQFRLRPHLSPAVAAHALRRERLALDDWGPYAGIGVLPCHPVLLAVGVTARQDAGDEGEENNVSHGGCPGQQR